MAEVFTGITVQGLYNDQTGDALYGVVGSAAPASALAMAGSDGTNLRFISTDATGKINVNASITTPSDVTNTGSITNTQAFSVSTQGASAVAFNITGTWTGTIVFEVSIDGTNFVSATAYPVDTGGASATSATANGQWSLPVGGFNLFRLRGNTVATGSATVWLEASQGSNILVAVSPTASDFNATVVVSGTVAVTQSTSPWVVAGNLTHNNAAPAANNVGVLGFLANAANPTFTEGDQVLGSVDLSGHLRTTTTVTGTVVVAGNLTNNNAAPAANNVGTLGYLAATAYTTNTYTTGNQVLGVTDLHGAQNIDLQAWHGTELGNATNFGTTPGAVIVGQVNASIFQGTAAITAANPLFTEISDGTNAMGTMANWGTNPGAVKALNVNASVWGTLTNNNAAPAATNVGVLPALANAASPADTEGDQVLLSVDLSGRIRARGTLSNNNAAPAADQLSVMNGVVVTAPQTYTAGNQALVNVTKGGTVIAIPADEQFASSLSYFSFDSGVTFKVTSNAVFTPLFSIQSNSATITFILRELQVATDGSLNQFILVKNAQTLTGSNFVTTGIPTGSHIKVDTSATAITVGTGTIVWSGYAASAFRPYDALMDAMAAGTPGDTYTIAAKSQGGSGKTLGQIRWSEQSASL